MTINCVGVELLEWWGGEVVFCGGMGVVSCWGAAAAASTGAVNAITPLPLPLPCACLCATDWNPNVLRQLATCGDDCTVKFWDVRATDKPVSVVSHHR